jgi:creatinine amidohydrolase
MPRLDRLTSPQVGDLAAANALCLLPIGQVEEHGPHLPTGTDAVIAGRIVEAAAQRLHPDPPTLWLPTVWTGYSGRELQQWPGTVRIRTRVFADLIFDLVGSLVQMGFRKVIAVNGHGHHPGILEMVAREVADELGVYMAVVDVAKLAAEAVRTHRQSAPGGCIHGCEFETALMLHLGEPVDMSLAPEGDEFRYNSPSVPGDGFAGSKLAFWSTWGIQQSRTGVYGAPALATPEFGAQVYEAAVERLVAFGREYWSFTPTP